LIYDHIHEKNRPLANYIEWARRIHGAEAEQAILRVESVEQYLDHAPVHITFSGTCADTEHLVRALEREVGQSVKLMTTLYPRLDFGLIDIIHPEVSKGTGLAAVVAEYGLTPAEVMAVGDNHNDVEMLHYAGLGVAMGNAEPVLRDDPRFHVTATNDEDGVALAIEKYILSTVSNQ
ncbi:MAG: HAD-IIB family hydrolase, partial [Acidobacteriota bacterium]|nr:HAD-IIB family hydrolase [Acidobacteriota bacterium]